MATITRTGKMTLVDALVESEQMPLRDQLSQDIARVTWGGARQFAAALTPFGLTLQQYFTLVAINGASACTMGMLASQTHHSLGTMTGIVDRLVRQGLVTRCSHPTDRRIVVVQLTASGKETLAQVEDMRQEQLDSALTKMGEPQARNLIRLLGQYLAAMEINATDALTGPGAFA
ncbi:MAG: MarR family transcriptional regulator [Thermomicrobia bacterium]|nr:MarR family transcriptional regulator [Thermomicrobia bacterium]MCA1724780.1 MarR family transcriptional regulator [Thermomicrobia bacterium]